MVRAATTGEPAVDARGKASGRGAYVCADPACLERGLEQGSLARALEIELDEETRNALRTELEQVMRERTTTD